MRPIPSGSSSFGLTLPNERALQQFAVDIGVALEPGDFVTLSGDLGAGKTTFARAIIRFWADDDLLEVPSPTFTLMQNYDLPRFPVVHADLYRLSGADELTELGFDDLPEQAVVLLEWPDRAAGRLPPDRFEIALTLGPQSGPDVRQVVVTGYGACAARADRMATVRGFLDRCGLAGARRQRLQGDASTRIYERMRLHGQDMVLMNAPRRPDGPAVRGSRPYSAIAHLAEDVKPFVAMARGLRERGFSAPDVVHADLEHGLLVLEDLGDERLVAGEPPTPIEERYAAAVDMLVALHAQDLPASIPVTETLDYRIPYYDEEALLIEAELLVDWYLPRFGLGGSDSLREDFIALWREALRPALADAPTWVLRDFHSPNLLWLSEREGIGRVGLLDFQDALIGPAAYDVASLLQDARVDVPQQTEVALLGRYAQARLADDPNFDLTAFIEVYATLAAQRATKILGIFARLDRRDGKPQYLRHMPRIWGYLQRALTHPSLAAVTDWYAAHVPPPDQP
jgi:hypothetical protein